MPHVLSTASASSAPSSQSDRITRRICFRRIPKAPITSRRNGASSSGANSGSASGVMRNTADSTLGGGEKAFAETPKSRSARASACTFTESAPYASSPAPATTRSATSCCTK